MNEPTRADLRVMDVDIWDEDIRLLEDAEFDRIAREQGYVKVFDDPIWWCFEHESAVHWTNGEPRCTYFRISAVPGRHHGLNPCDIALATRPQRLEATDA